MQTAFLFFTISIYLIFGLITIICVVVYDVYLLNFVIPIFIPKHAKRRKLHLVACLYHHYLILSRTNIIKQLITG